MLLVDLNYNFECDWFVELSDNKLSHNKLSDNNLASEFVGNRSFLNQSQLRKLWFLWLIVKKVSVVRMALADYIKWSKRNLFEKCTENQKFKCMNGIVSVIEPGLN